MGDEGVEFVGLVLLGVEVIGDCVVIDVWGLVGGM